MATEQKCFSVGTQLANADLSAKQFYAVKLADASGVAQVALASSAGEGIFGILQNKPTSGLPADVCVLGVTKAVAGAAITSGAQVMTNASGKIITAATAGSAVVGFALETAAGDGSIITICLTAGGDIV